MEDHAELLSDDSIRFERLLPGPIERVWAFLVDGEKRARWFCGGRTGAAVGELVELAFDNSQLSGPDDPVPDRYREFDGPVQHAGTITRYEPPRVLAHTWEFEGEASEVCYELEHRGEQVLLRLTHTRLGPGEDRVGVLAGWHAHLGILTDVLSGRPRRPFWTTHSALEAEYAARLRA